jgi:hypothetical protein
MWYPDASQAANFLRQLKKNCLRLTSSYNISTQSQKFWYFDEFCINECICIHINYAENYTINDAPFVNAIHIFS